MALTWLPSIIPLMINESIGLGKQKPVALYTYLIMNS